MRVSPLDKLMANAIPKINTWNKGFMYALVVKENEEELSENTETEGIPKSDLELSSWVSVSIDQVYL